MLKAPLELIKARAIASRDVAVQVKEMSAWEWALWLIPAMSADIAAFEIEWALVLTKDSAESSVRTAFNSALGALHLRCTQDLPSAKVYFAGDPAKFGRFENLLAGGKSVNERFDEAEKLIIAWEGAEAGWSPRAGHTLQALKDMLAQCKTLQTQLGTAHSDDSAEHKTFNALANALWDKSVDWYTVATGQFNEETPEGQLIRANVPTSYTPPPVVPPVVPEPPA